MNNIELNPCLNFLKLRFSKYHCTDNSAGAPHHYFAYMEKGHAKIVAKNKTIYINEGDIFYIPKNLSYFSHWYGNDEISFNSYSLGAILAIDASFLDLQVISCPKELAMQLSRIPTSGADLTAEIIGNFYSTIAKLLPYMKKCYHSAAQELLIAAKNHLNSFPHCTNSQLAQVCNISIPYLYKIFKKYENISPNNYRQKVLCDKASEILATTDLSIEEISSFLKFSSSAYFRKIFKEHTGSTPREYRKTYSL